MERGIRMRARKLFLIQRNGGRAVLADGDNAVSEPEVHVIGQLWLVIRGVGSGCRQEVVCGYLVVYVRLRDRGLAQGLLRCGGDTNITNTNI